MSVARALLALAALVSFAACTKEHGAVAPTFQRMLVQPRYEPYGASAFFPDGRAMRAPPEGTVPHEGDVASLAPEAGAGGATGGTIPVPVTAALLAVGRARFGIYCAVCHGERGDGRSVVGSNMTECPPPSLLALPIRALTPATLHAVIVNGFGRMPSYAAELTPTERWAVVVYVRELQRRSSSAAGADTTPRVRPPGCGARP